MDDIPDLDMITIIKVHIIEYRLNDYPWFIPKKVKTNSKLTHSPILEFRSYLMDERPLPRNRAINHWIHKFTFCEFNNVYCGAIYGQGFFISG